MRRVCDYSDEDRIWNYDYGYNPKYISDYYTSFEHIWKGEKFIEVNFIRVKDLKKDKVSDMSAVCITSEFESYWVGEQENNDVESD